jgi:nucleotide-binding universal stress UspA family protein
MRSSDRKVGAASEERVMTSPGGEHPVVVGVDGSACALQASIWAAAEARQRHVPLRLLYCCDLPPVRHPRHQPPPAAYRAAVQAQGRHWLNQAARAVRIEAPDVALSADMRAGVPADILIDESREARMVVVGTRGLGGFRELLVGSVAMALAANGHCPVVVHRGTRPACTAQHGTPPPQLPIVVGVDGSTLSEAALGFAFAAAGGRGAPLLAVHTWLDANSAGMWAGLPWHIDWPAIQAEEERLLDHDLAPWREKFPGVAVSTDVRRDRPEHALVAHGAAAQLVVVGSRGRGSLVALGLGSVSHTLLHTTDCPVVVVRPEPAEARHPRHHFWPGTLPAA